IHLAAEYHQLVQLDATFQQQRPVDGRGFRLAGFEFGGHNATAHQLLGGSHLVGSIDHAIDGIALTVATLVGEGIHAAPRTSQMAGRCRPGCSLPMKLVITYPRSSANRSTSSTDVIPWRA